MTVKTKEELTTQITSTLSNTGINGISELTAPIIRSVLQNIVDTYDTKADTDQETVGTGGLATDATSGFAYIPACEGTPTGTPDTQTGFLPLVIDSTNGLLYFYSGSAWVALTNVS